MSTEKPNPKEREAIRLVITATVRPLILEAFVTLNNNGIVAASIDQLGAKIQEIHPNENYQRLAGKAKLFMALDVLEKAEKIFCVRPRTTTDGKSNREGWMYQRLVEL